MKRGWLIALATIILAGGIVSTGYAETKIGGEVRGRGVTGDNKEAATTPTIKHTSGGFFEQRTRINADANVNDTTKVFIQVQDSRKWGSEDPMPTTEVLPSKVDRTIDTGDNDNGGIDLSQGYVELSKLFGLSPVSVKMGRQAMFYGEQRLIGSLEWSNNARRFDALKFMYKHNVVDIDVWTAKIVENGGEDWGNDDNLNGVYATLKNIPKNAVDVYLLEKVAGATNLNLYTIGARVKGTVENVNVDYNAEAAIQSGDFDTNSSQSASAYAIRAGYTLPDMKGLRVGVEYDAATGNKASASPGTTAEDNKAFDNLYPTNHYLYGFTDDVNWTNLNAWSLNISLKPVDKLNLAVEYWNYQRAEKTSAGKDDNGTEMNVKANYELSKSITCEAAYVIRDSGDIATSPYDTTTFGSGTLPADKSASFGYFLINVKFNFPGPLITVRPSALQRPSYSTASVYGPSQGPGGLPRP